MALTLTPTPFQQVLVDGEPQSGAKITTYTAGTTTAAATYTTSAGDVANANPIVADAQGRYVAYLSAGASYKFVITTSADVAIDTQDNVSSVPGASVNLDVLGTVGEAVTAGQVVYISDGSGSKTAGLWYLTDSDNTYSSSSAAEIGIVPSAIVINAEGTIRLAGRIATAGSVVVGSLYYCSATPGAMTASAPANVRTIGIADTTSTIILNANTAVTGLPNPITQDLLFTDNTYDIGKIAASRPRDGFFTRNAVVGGTLGVTGVATLTAQPILSTLTASRAVFSDGSKGLVSNAITGTGNVVMSASPTLTGTIGAAAMTLSTPLPVASGGTGIAAITANTVMLGAGTSDVTLLAPGTSGNLMTSNGTVWGSTAPAASAVQGLNVAEGRLTLTSGTPVTTADVTGATSVYYTPYVGNTISLYDGSSAWTNVVFTQITISLSGFTASKPYDIFIYDNSGTATVETLIWTNTTTRATALAYQDGVLVKSGATTRRYVGTVYINASGGQTDDSEVKRYLQNYYHRVKKSLRRIETTASWTYTLTTKRQANGSTANQVDVMVGVSEGVLELQLYVQGLNASAGVRRTVEIAEDATDAFNLQTTNPLGWVMPYTGGGEQGAGLFIVRRTPAVGRHFYAWVENSDATGTTYFYGNAGSDGRHGGMVGSWEC